MIAHISKDGLNREQSVAEHITGVIELCEEKGRRLDILNIAKICALLHDIGKEKEEFENYIRADEDRQNELRGKIDHSTAGAKFIYDKYHNKEHGQNILVEIISCVIASHHGVFDCVEESKREYFFERLSNVKHYEEILKNSEKEILSQYNLEEMFENAREEFGNIFKNICKISSGNKSEFFFYLSCFNRLLLSILIDSDWEDTSRFMSGSKSKNYACSHIFSEASNNFDAYMKNIKNSFSESQPTDKEQNIYRIRNDIQRECKEFAENPEGIYCLPIPTGGGKTLSGLSYALQYAKEHKDTERIIYVAPYISVIEQNAEVIRKAIGNDEWLLEHHSNVAVDDDITDENDEAANNRRLDINWDVPFVCTTFVQFMNTLFSDKKQSIRRMNRLAHAVIIIDEVQAMPIKCIYTFNCMMNFLKEVCHTNIVLCTATQPLLDDRSLAHPIQYSEPKNMIKTVEERFRQFERVNIIPKIDRPAYSMEELAEEIEHMILKYNTILIVLNTKSAVKNMYELLSAQEVDGVHVEYLTTNLCAEHRKEKLDRIKNGLEDVRKNNSRNNDKWIVVSTNLIEAGVDISFECVYRSIAGMDSIAQTAGRCNRNGEIERGTVYVVDVEGENRGAMKDLKMAISASRQVIQAYDESESLLTPYWMSKYYKRYYFSDEQKDKMFFAIREKNTNVYELLSCGFAGKGNHNILNQAYRSAGKAYKIIDEYTVGVIVPYGRGRELIDVMRQTNDYEKMKKLIRLVQRYTVNISEYKLKDLLERGIVFRCNEFFSDIYIAMESSYCDETGFVEEQGTLIF